MKFFDVKLRVSVLSVKARNQQHAAAICEKWLETAAPALPQPAAPLVSFVTAEEVELPDYEVLEGGRA